MGRRDTKEKVLPSHNAYDWTHIQNDNSWKTSWYSSNPNGLAEITDIIRIIWSCQFEEHVYPIQTYDYSSYLFLKPDTTWKKEWH